MVLSFFKRKKKEEPKAKAQPSQPKQSQNYKEIVEEGLTGLKYHYNYNEKDKSIDLLSPGILDAWVENPGQIKEDYLKELFEEATYMIPNPHKEMTSLKKINISDSVEPSDYSIAQREGARNYNMFIFLKLTTPGGVFGSFGVVGTADKDWIKRRFGGNLMAQDLYLVGSLSGFFISDNLAKNSDISFSLKSKDFPPILRQHSQLKPILSIVDNSEYTAYQAGHLLKSGLKNNKILSQEDKNHYYLYYSFKDTDPALITFYALETVKTGAVFGLTREEIKEALEEVFTSEISKSKDTNTVTKPVEINEERLIYSTYNLGASEDNDYPELLSELRKNLNQKGYELYQDVIVIIKKGALRPIYYSLIYPVKKETAEEVGSKVTLYRVKTDEETGKVINLEPIEEHKVKGTIDDLIELRNKEVIDIYKDLVPRYGRDPLEEGENVYLPIILHDLCINKSVSLLSRSKEHYKNFDYLSSFLRNNSGRIQVSNIDMVLEKYGFERGAEYLLGLLNRAYSLADEILRSNMEIWEIPTMGGPVIFSGNDVDSLQVFYL